MFAPIEQALGVHLPAFYRALAAEFGLSQRDAHLSAHTTLYRLPELVELNQAYRIQHYLPDCVMVGNDGGGYAIVLRADDSGDSNIYTCGLGALAPDELAVLAPSVTHWRRLGWPSDGHRWYETRDLTARLHSAEWQARCREAAIRGFLRHELAALDAQRLHGTVQAKDYLQRKRVLQWLAQRVPGHVQD